MSEAAGTTTTTAPAAIAGAQANPTIPGDPQTGDVKAAAQEAIRKLKYKQQDGTDAEVDESEALKVYMERKQHQSVASKALNEGKALRKQAEEFVQMLKDEGKLKDVLKKLGHDPRKLSEKILAEHLEEELMDPRDRELKETKTKLRQMEDFEKQQEEAVKAKRLEEMKSRFMKEYETDFVAALQETKLPPTKPMVAEMAKYISRAAKLGFKMTPKEAAQLVKEDITQLTQRVIGDSDGEVLLNLLGGDAVANKIRKWDTSKLRNPTAELTTPAQQGETRQKPERKKMSVRDWQLYKRGLK